MDVTSKENCTKKGVCDDCKYKSYNKDNKRLQKTMVFSDLVDVYKDNSKTKFQNP